MLVWKLNLYITIFTKNIFRLLRYILRTLYRHDEPDGLYATVAPWRFRECTSEDIVLPISNISCQKSQIACRSHMSLSGWWAISAGCPRCKHLGDVYIGFGSDHLRVLICPVNTNYWVTRNWKNIVLCVCSNRYTYTPHSCIIASVPLVPQCQARGCIPKRCGLSYVGGRCHIEKWTVDLYICPAVLLHASWRLHSRHVAVYIWFAEFNSQSARHLMFP